ncbi:MAG: hypothetical protein A2Y72_06050 [Chloroflexi bacterium RBG_13_53_26]|jgi:hypothetical protein|nr:MAG: hypothetical protein A2Y72_06050 [Chloroflexi bacterium RBG_13_53_26]
MLSRYLPILVIALGIASLAMGIGFIVEGKAKSDLLTDAMREEQITLGLTQEQIDQGSLVDTAGEAEKAGDTIREHRRSIAPTYGDLLGDGRFDPENPAHVTYMQALNLETYLYFAVASFGLTTAVQVTGIVMIITGIALAAIGVVVMRLRKAASQPC